MICDTCADKNYCEPHRRLGENIVICGAHKKPPTNADRIRSMSDEELKTLFCEVAGDCPKCKFSELECMALDWLKSPADGGDGDD